MKILLRVAVIVALLAANTVFQGERLESRARSGELHRRDAPNSFFGLFVFGGFRSLFLEHLWSKADALVDEGRYWEVADVFERIARLDPENPNTWRVQVYFFVHNVAQNEVDDAMRWRLYHRALRHLDRGIAATNGDYFLLELRCLILFRHIAADPYLSRHARTNLGADGLTLAMEAASVLRERWPDVSYSHGWYRRVGEEVTEHVLNAGEFAGAAPPLEELAVVAETIRRRFPDIEVGEHEARTLRTWAGVVRDLGAAADWKAASQSGVIRDEEALERALGAVQGLLETPGAVVFEEGVERLDEAVLNVICFRVMQLCQARCAAGDHDGALRALSRLRRICDLAEGASSPGTLYYSTVYVSSFERFLALDRDLRTTGERDDAEASRLREEWQAGLDHLDELFRTRTGRTDGFRKRMIRARAEKGQ